MAELTGERTGRAEQVIGSILDRIWRFFCSVRAAAFEILFLALLVLVGTLRGSVIPAQIPRYVPAAGAETSGRDFGQHHACVAQQIGLSGTHNPGVHHQGYSNFTGTFSMCPPGEGPAQDNDAPAR